MTRRDIFQFPMLFAGVPALCCDTPDLPAEAVKFQQGALVIDLRLAAELRHQGGAVKFVDEARRLNLILTHPERNQFVVLDRPCTHGNGPVAYSEKKHTVQCTCWGRSEFALDGKVLGGAAKKPLRVYETRLTGPQLEIRLEAKS